MLLLISLLLTTTTTWAATTNNQQPPQTVMFGATPMGSTQWTSEGGNSVTVDVSTSHLSLTSIPTYVTRVVSRNSQYATFDTIGLGLDVLANITGTAIPRSTSPNGFKTRLRSNDLNKNISVATAKASDFRVVWMAATSKHPGLENHVANSVGAHAEIVKQILNEEPVIMKGFFLPGEIQPMLRNIPKPIPPKPRVKENSTSSSSSSNNNGANDEKESKTSA